MSHERSHHYPPLNPLTPEEERKADKIMGIDKKSMWKKRIWLLSREVLDASDATKEEKAFLLGISDIDETPKRKITYMDLEPAEELVTFEGVGREVPQRPEIRIPKPNTNDRRVDKILFRLGIYELTSPKRGEDISASVKKQAQFLGRLHAASILALTASDATFSEITFLKRKRYSWEDPHDPAPEHVIQYRRLKAKPAEMSTT